MQFNLPLYSRLFYIVGGSDVFLFVFCIGFFQSFVILILVNGRIYKESRYERLKAEFDRMENSEKKRRRTIFWIFTGITLLAGYAAYRLFCRFNMQFLLP